MCYALGALDTYDGIYDIEAVRMTIFQPRRNNVSTFTMKKQDLLGWAENALKPAEISAILPRIDELVSWAGDIKDYALQSALSGTDYPGYKVVEGRSTRKYTDETAVASAIKDNEFDPYEKDCWESQP